MIYNLVKNVFFVLALFSSTSSVLAIDCVEDCSLLSTNCKLVSCDLTVGNCTIESPLEGSCDSGVCSFGECTCPSCSHSNECLEFSCDVSSPEAGCVEHLSELSALNGKTCETDGVCVSGNCKTCPGCDNPEVCFKNVCTDPLVGCVTSPLDDGTSCSVNGQCQTNGTETSCVTCPDTCLVPNECFKSICVPENPLTGCSVPERRGSDTLCNEDIGVCGYLPEDIDELNFQCVCPSCDHLNNETDCSFFTCNDPTVGCVATHHNETVSCNSGTGVCNGVDGKCVCPSCDDLNTNECSTFTCTDALVGCVETYHNETLQCNNGTGVCDNLGSCVCPVCNPAVNDCHSVTCTDPLVGCVEVELENFKGCSLLQQENSSLLLDPVFLGECQAGQCECPVCVEQVCHDVTCTKTALGVVPGCVNVQHFDGTQCTNLNETGECTGGVCIPDSLCAILKCERTECTTSIPLLDCSGCQVDNELDDTQCTNGLCQNGVCHKTSGTVRKEYTFLVSIVSIGMVLSQYF